jgi:hypothetical protein
MLVAQRHISLDADRPALADHREKLLAKIAQATLAVPTVGSTRTRRFGAVTIR